MAGEPTRKTKEEKQRQMAEQQKRTNTQQHIKTEPMVKIQAPCVWTKHYGVENKAVRMRDFQRLTNSQAKEIQKEWEAIPNFEELTKQNSDDWVNS